ncbi:MAG TPA: Hsp70 family protein, partial [Planctomycetaceae bacterium]|nr:Hsp70 family protein [Planctomycetaceae bacterium]
QRTRDTVELVLQQAGVDYKSLDEVLLVGGSTHMPAVAALLTEISGRKPSRVLDPDIAVAQGAAVPAAILEARAAGGGGRMGTAVLKRLRAVTSQDVNSHSLGVEVSEIGGDGRRRNHIMIPRNTPIPHRVVQRFVTNVANPSSIHVRLLEGETEDVDGCTLIGDFRIVDLPKDLPVGSPVELNYSYDANGRIHVAGRELTGNSKATTEIQRDWGLTDSGLEAFKALARDYFVE